MAGGAGDERRRAAQLAALEARVAALEGAAGRLGEAERGHLAAALAQALEQMPPGMEAALRRGSEGPWAAAALGGGRGPGAGGRGPEAGGAAPPPSRAAMEAWAAEAAARFEAAEAAAVRAAAAGAPGGAGEGGEGQGQGQGEGEADLGRAPPKRQLKSWFAREPAAEVPLPKR